jgi:hypothetical protein
VFETFPQAEIRVPPGILGLGVKCWHCVLRSTAEPWFHVTYDVLRDGESWAHVMLCDRVEQLTEFCRPSPDGICVQEVQLISPSWLNGTDRWKMERLAELWQCSDRTQVGRANIFVMEDGSRYSEASVKLTSEEPGEMVLRFKLPSNLRRDIA